MGRIFYVEKEEPAFTCVTCNMQVALCEHLVDDWLNLYMFSRVYNVFIGKEQVPCAGDVDFGFEVNCVNCCNLLGWQEAVTDDLLPRRYFHFKHSKVTPPPPENLPPPPENPPPPQEPQLPPPPPDVQQ